jgi:hypothetical protein
MAPHCFTVAGMRLEGAAVRPHFSAIETVDIRVENSMPTALEDESCGRLSAVATNEVHGFRSWRHWRRG